MGLSTSVHNYYCNKKDELSCNKFLIIINNNSNTEIIEIDDWEECINKLYKRYHDKYIIDKVIKHGYYKNKTMNISIRHRDKIQFRYLLFINITSVSYSGDIDFILSKTEDIRKDVVLSTIENFGIYKSSDYIIQRYPIYN